MRRPFKSNRLPAKVETPSSVEEAKTWLRAVADYITSVPYASSRLRFHARAISQFLDEGRSLTAALGLKQEKVAKRGRPRVTSEIEKSIVRMLIQKKSVSDIAGTVNKSRKYVELVRADYHAIIWKGSGHGLLDDDLLRQLIRTPDDKLSEARRAMLEDIHQAFETRERKVSKGRRKAIIEAMADSITADEILS